MYVLSVGEMMQLEQEFERVVHIYKTRKNNTPETVEVYEKLMDARKRHDEMLASSGVASVYEWTCYLNDLKREMRLFEN